MASETRNVNDIINFLVATSKMEDSFLYNTPRWAIQLWVRKGLQEITEKHVAQVRALRLPVSDNNTVELPLDYVKLLRVSEFSDCGKLVPIGVDASIMIANSYLLDNLDKILLDHNGVALTGSGDGDIQRDCYEFDYSSCSGYRDRMYYDGYYSSYGDYNRYINLNDSFAPEVKYRVDLDNNRIQLSGRDVEEVVLEYNFNPIKSVGSMSQLQVHRYFADALEKYAYMSIISNKRDVPANEKERVRRDYREALQSAKINKNMPDINAITFTTNLK